MKHLCALLLLGSLVVRGYGQLPAEDSLRVYPMREIVVSSTRSPIALAESPSPVDVYSPQELAAMPAQSVADALALSSGVSLTDYGSYGALKTPSLRGSAQEQVLVLLNGHRLNSAQNGLADLSLLPLENVRQIEVLHGGNSALYGADALGGVVNILTRYPSEPFRVSGSASGGSYGYQKYSLEAEGTAGAFGLIAGYGSERGRDNYDYPDPLAPVTDARRNSDFFLRQAYLQGSVVPDDRSTLLLNAQQVIADRGAPGPTTFPSDARQADHTVDAAIEYDDRHLDGIDARLGADVHYNLETYVDPNPGFPVNSFYHTVAYTLNPEISAIPMPQLHLRVGLEAGASALGSNDFDNRIVRHQTSVYFTQELRLEADRPLFDRLAVFGALRTDAFTGVDAAVTPKIGFNARIARAGEIRIRSSYGTSFRMPTFNDLYFRYFGNPLLKPERSHSFDVGVTAAVAGAGTTRLAATYFLLTTDDRILFDPVQFIPLNIGKVRSDGVELSLDHALLDDRLSGGVEYAYCSAIDKTDPASDAYGREIPFQPKEVWKVHLDARTGPASVTIRETVYGSRMTTVDNSGSLPGFHSTSLGLLIDKPFLGLSAKGEINNLFDRHFQTYPGYPMPGRTFRLSLRWES